MLRCFVSEPLYHIVFGVLYYFLLSKCGVSFLLAWLAKYFQKIHCNLVIFLSLENVYTSLLKKKKSTPD